MGVGCMRREGSWMFRQRGTGGMRQAGGGATIVSVGSAGERKQD